MKIPDGHQTVMPYLIVKGADEFVNFLKKIFNAKELMTVPRPDGGIMHAEYQIGTATIMLANATDEYKPAPAALYVYVDNADDVYQRALQAGATSVQEPANRDYGRSCGVRDAFGNTWWIVSAPK